MANTVIKLKKSSEVNKAPSPSDLDYGEIAINYADGKLFYKNTSGLIASVSGGGAGGDNFGVVNVAGQLLIADTSGDFLTINNGDNIELSANIFNDSFTITANLKPAFDVANSAFDAANNVGPQIAPAYNTANGAYDKANSANVLAYNTGIGANNYAGAMANAANSYASATYSTLTQLGDNWTVTNAAFGSANSRLANTSNVTFGGWLYFPEDSKLRMGSSSSDAPLGQLEIKSSSVVRTLLASDSYSEIRFNDKNNTGNPAYITYYPSGTLETRLDANNGEIRDYSDFFVWGNYNLGQYSTVFTLNSLTRQINHTGSMNIANSLIVGTTNVAPSFISANAYAGFMANSGNVFTGLVYTAVNSAFAVINAAFTSSNADYTLTNAAYTSANANYVVTNAAFAVANAAYGNANSIAISANAYAGFMANASNTFARTIVDANLIVARAYTNTSVTAANNYAGAMVNAANAYANSTYVKLSSSSQTISGDLSITGNLNILGSTVTHNTDSFVVSDPLVLLASNNTADVVDIGFIAHYANATNDIVHTGFFRDHESKEWFIFKEYNVHALDYDGHIGTTGNNFTVDVLNASLRTSNLNLGGANAIVWIKTAFDTVNAAYTSSNADYVLTNAAFNSVNSVAIAANNYAGAMANASNTFARTIVDANLIVARAYTNTSTTAANNYAGAMANSGNAWTQSIVDANLVTARAYTNTSVTSANNYAGAMANSGNAWATATFATISTVATNATSANNYAGAMANSGNAYAATVGTSTNAYSVATFATITNAAAAFAFANGVATNVTAAFAAANAEFTFSNTIYAAVNSAFAVINAAYTSSNADYVLTNAAYTSINAGYTVANAAFGRANTALQNTTGTFAGSLTTTGSLSANNLIALAQNGAGEGGELRLVGSGSNPSWIIDSVGTSLRHFSDLTGVQTVSFFNPFGGANAVNMTVDGTATINGMNITPTIAASYTVANAAFGSVNSVATSANNYAGAMANASNTFARTIVDANLIVARAYTNTSTTAANNYATATFATITYATAAFAAANAKVASVSGTSGRITSSGGTAPTIDLATAGAGAATYSSGISALTVDAYGRVTSVTGSAGYVTSSGVTSVAAGTGLSGGTITSTGTISMPNVGPGAGSYSSGISALTIDAQGRITAVTGSAGYITSSGSITGSAGSVTGLTLNSSASAINPDNVTQNQLGYNNSVSLFGQTDGGLYSSAFSSAWIHQIYGDFRTGQVATRGKNNGTWQAWRVQLDSSNYTSYAPTLTGSGASGTWGISVTGNAGTVTNGVYTTGDQTIGGTKTLSGLLVGRVPTTSGVSAGNDTGSFSIRGSTSLSAHVSFHRSGAYAINMGLDTDNVFRIGGWSDGANTFRLQLAAPGGTHTFTGTVSASADVRAPVFYDSVNTGYYLDPNASTSIRTVGDWRADASAWTGEFAGKIQYHSNHWYFQAAADWRFRSSAGADVFYINQSGHIFTPIMYDSNDTGWYVDPTGFLRISALQSIGTSGNWNTDFTNTPANGLRYTGDLNSGTNCPTGGGWWFLQNYRHSNSSNFWGVQVAWGWEDRSNRLFTRNVSGGSFGTWHEYLSTTGATFSGSLTMSGNITAYSDLKLKNDIQIIDNAIDKIKQIRGVTFTRNDLEDKERRYSGIIAQEVEKVLPEVVFEDKDGFKNVAYGNMVGLLIEAIKEQQAQIDELKRRV
jgi:hypothetical protein